MNKNHSEQQTPSIDRFVREKECQHITGLSRTSRYEMEQAGTFPKRIQLNKRTTAWRLSDLLKWMEACING